MEYDPARLSPDTGVNSVEGPSDGQVNNSLAERAEYRKDRDKKFKPVPLSAVVVIPFILELS